MRFRWFPIFLLPVFSSAQDKVAPGSRAGQPMVNVAKAVPQIAIELRYATDRNLAKIAIYPKDARCFLRQSVADRLAKAQEWLNGNTPKGTRLKIWDGWRPASTQDRLWKVRPDKKYLADPRSGSLHTWGVAVDATLCDAQGRDLRMPTDFDVLSPDAQTFYKGSDPEVRRNLFWLQSAMTFAGFQVLLDEWWHFVARDWQAYAPTTAPFAEESQEAAQQKPLPSPPKKTAIPAKPREDGGQT